MIVRRWCIMFMKIAALFNITKTNTLYAIQLLIVSSLDMSTQIIHATLNIATPLCRCLSQSANTFHIHIIMSCEQSNNSGYNIQHTVITLANSHLHPMPKDPYPYLTMPYISFHWTVYDAAWHHVLCALWLQSSVTKLLLLRTSNFC